jgi:putrescine transport system ATP-binding protein
LREQTQFELMNIQDKIGTTFVLVTHDQEEAMALSTRIAVMEQGEVRQVGTPADVYEFPQSRFVADFIGTTNLFECVVTGCAQGRINLHCPAMDGTLVVEDSSRVVPGQRVCVSVRPEKITLGKAKDETGCNCVAGVVWELGYLGNRSIYRVKTGDGRIVVVSAANARRTAEWAIDWNDQVYARWRPDAATLLLS